MGGPLFTNERPGQTNDRTAHRGEASRVAASKAAL